MSVAILREAAALMRARAEGVSAAAQWTGGHYWVPDYDGYGEPIQSEIGGMGSAGDAAHYSSWHPAVALAVADWLDRVADDEPSWSYSHAETEMYSALTIAHTYLAPADAAS